MILITGGNGYLGGRLAMFFSTFGKKKVVITSRDRSAEPNKILSECDRRIMDITNIDQVNNCLEDITDVIHLVSPNAKACMEDPELAKEINIDGTRNLVRACKDRKVNRFIYFSTAHIYRSPLIGFIDENTTPFPIHPYATTHLEAEKIVIEGCSESDTSPIILRLSNAIGPPVDKEADCWMLVINDIARQIATNGRMEFRSQRSTRRDYIGINQVCKILSEIIFSSRKISGIYNLGGGRAISLEELAQLISQRVKKTLGKSIESNFPKDDDQDNTELTFSIEKIEKEIANIDSNLEKEIDDLLISSQKWFSQAE